MPYRQAYLHGFASSSLSYKGQALRRSYAERGATLHTPDLNHPSFAELSYTGMLEAFARFDAELDAQAEDPAPGRARWRLIGSSMGAYLASRWAQLHGARVDRLLLLCPAFDLVERWPAMLGAQAFERWREQGTHEYPDASGQLVPVHYGLYTDAQQHPARPQVECPTVIIHGTRDESVPIACSRSYAAAHPHVELIEVDDDHSLADSLELIERVAHAFLLEPRPRLLWDYRGPQAQGTAEHFLRHLDEFLEREGFEGCATGVQALGPAHSACFCVCAEGQVAKLGPALRPHRIDHWSGV